MIPDEITKPIKDFMSKNKWAIIITISAVIIGLGSIAFLGKDNPIEQEAEKLIELETGVTLDITPDKS